MLFKFVVARYTGFRNFRISFGEGRGAGHSSTFIGDINRLFRSIRVTPNRSEMKWRLDLN